MTRRRRVDNIRMDLGMIWWGDVDWIGLTQDRGKWRTLLNVVMNLRVSRNAGKLSSGFTTIERALQWYSKCYCVAKTFTLKIVQTIHRSRFWEPLHYQWKSHWTVTIPGKTRCVLLHRDSSKHCTCPMNKFIQAFKVVKLFFFNTLYFRAHVPCLLCVVHTWTLWRK
jgi:hypothetical protein